MIFNLITISPIYLLLVGTVAILGFGLAIYGIYALVKWRTNISNRVEEFIFVEDQLSNNTPVSQIIPREIKGSLFNRTILNLFGKLLHFLGKFTPEKMVIDIEHKLTIAGNPGNLSAGEFYALRLILVLTGGVVAFLLNRDIQNINLTSLGFGVGAILMGMVLPDMWLKSRMRTRQDEIRRGLPDALDMLSVCTSAGLSFDQSLQKISGYWDTELGHEFKRVTQEMEMGVSRSVALKNMSRRVEVDDLTRFIAIIVQAEKVGMSYADVLHSQALQMRIERQYRAREIANKLPGKMILPLALLIFPAMMAVILGPSIPVILDLFQSM